MSKKKSTKDGKNEYIQMDELSKLLFFSSPKMTLNILNFLFKENYHEDEVIISKENIEFIEDIFLKLEVIRSDFIVKVLEKTSNKEQYYHIELQTINNKEMIYRMNQYALNFVKEKSKEQKYKNIDFVEYPKQYVVFFEENSEIKDSLKQEIKMSHDKDAILYEIPVLKFWECSVEFLKENELYTLIPLKLFNLRIGLNRAKRKKDLNFLKERFNEVFESVKLLINISNELFSDKLIDETNFDNMLMCIKNIFYHYNIKYNNSDKNIKREVDNMIKSVLQPVKMEGKMEGKAESTIELLEDRFNPSSDVVNEIKNKLMKITDFDILGSLFKEAMRCVDLDSFIKKIK